MCTFLIICCVCCFNFYILFEFILQLKVEDSDVDNNDYGDDDVNSTLFENPLKPTTKNKLLKEIEEVLICDTNPIMVCSNSMNKTHKCVFCKCFECHMKETKKEEVINSKKRKGEEKRSDSKRTRNQSKRVQRAKNISQGSISSKVKCSKVRNIDEDEEHRCDHVDGLSFFTDASFFTKSYKLRNEKINQDSKKSDVFLPTKCALCDREIVNKIRK